MRYICIPKKYKKTIQISKYVDNIKESLLSRLSKITFLNLPPLKLPHLKANFITLKPPYTCIIRFVAN